MLIINWNLHANGNGETTKSLDNYNDNQTLIEMNRIVSPFEVT